MKNYLLNLRKGLKFRKVKLSFILLFIFLLVGCGSANKGGDNLNKGDYTNESAGSGDVNQQIIINERKIVYIYTCSIYTDDLNGSINQILDHLFSYQGAYIETSSKSSNNNNKYANYKLRIPSEHFNNFIKSLESAGDIAREDLTSEDVTKSYFDLEAQKTAKEEEIARLYQLYDKATTLSEIDYISRRITEAQAQLNNINSSILNYDLLVQFSTVNINIHESSAPVEPNFGSRFTTVMKNLGGALLVFFEFALYFVICVTPFAAIFGIIIFGIYKINKKIFQRKKNKK